MSQEHNSHKRHEIVEKLLSKLTQDDPQMYYASTAVVARAIHNMIKEHEAHLHTEDQIIAKHMTIADIEQTLSYHHDNQ